MFKAAIKSVVAHKLRLALTALAIVLGVAFVSGTYVFTDTINSTFDTLIESVYQGTDVVVRGDAPDFGDETVTIPEEVLDIVLAVDGVRAAAPSVEGFAQLIVDGDAIGGQGPPTLGFSWSDEASLNPMRLRDGTPPQGPGEILIDANTADTNGIAIGDVVDVSFIAEPEPFTVVGIATFGDSASLAGATLSFFDLETAQRVFQSEGVFSGIAISAAEGADVDQLLSDISAALPAGTEAILGSQQADEEFADVEAGLGFLNTALLSFAAVSVFVGAFIIYNTFRVIVAQRSRELAMMRAIGATGAQVTIMMVIEALLVALIASAIGIVTGIGVAAGIRGLMDAVGFSPPEGALTILPRTIVVGFAVGIIVTLVSAVLPARRASKASPIEAMRGGDDKPRRSLARRATAGSVVAGLGVAVLFFGLFGGVDNAIAYVGLGALVTFLGVAVLAPLAAKPIAKVVGWPLPRISGVTGQLAQENAIRTPRRTASTASALMIGVALVAFVSIFAASISASVSESIFANFPADLSFQSTNFTDGPGAGVSPAFTQALRELDEVESVSPLKFGEWRDAEGTVGFLESIDPATVEAVRSLGIETGSISALAGAGVLVHVDTADDAGIGVGDTVQMEFALTGVQTVPVVGTFNNNDFGANYVIGNDYYLANFSNEFDALVFANVADGFSLEDSRAAADALAAEFGNVEVQNKSEFVAEQEAQINGLLSLFYGLLGLAVLIAVLGITNTLALSVFERTREIGLLRAVGMSRRQVRGMIRWESVIIALFGAILGIAVGSLFGWAVVTALSDVGIGVLEFPVGQLLVFLVLAGIAGVVAAALPARKAARLNVLEAIAYE